MRCPLGYTTLMSETRSVEWNFFPFSLFFITIRKLLGNSKSRCDSNSCKTIRQRQANCAKLQTVLLL